MSPLIHEYYERGRAAGSEIGLGEKQSAT
jgi:hypothetical protein